MTTTAPEVADVDRELASARALLSFVEAAIPEQAPAALRLIDQLLDARHQLTNQGPQ